MIICQLQCSIRYEMLEMSSSWGRDPFSVLLDVSGKKMPLLNNFFHVCYICRVWVTFSIEVVLCRASRLLIGVTSYQHGIDIN